MSLVDEARQFLRSTHSGMLCTNSVKFAGYPFGSVAPFVLDHDGQPLLLISTIAEHTKNIMADCKVSLLVFSPAEDLQASARLTLLGEAEQTDKQDGLLKARYQRYLPQAEQYFAMHDLLFYRLQIRQARYIAGFGSMGWLDGAEFRSPRSPLIAQEAGIIEHMNNDHQANMKIYCQHFHGITPDNVEMAGIDADGFDLRTDQQILRFDFKQPIHDATEARAALVEIAKACRA